MSRSVGGRGCVSEWSVDSFVSHEVEVVRVVLLIPDSNRVGPAVARSRFWIAPVPASRGGEGLRGRKVETALARFYATNYYFLPFPSLF